MEIKMIDMKDVVPNKTQPRQEFNQEKLQELANSIREGELLQPIVVRINGNKSKYQIVCGERRFKAFQILKEPKIPAIIRVIKDDTDALEKSLIENLQRDDLTSVERENAIGQLWESNRYKSKSDLARKLGYSLDKDGHSYLHELLEARDTRKNLGLNPRLTTNVIQRTGGLPEDTRKKLLMQVEEGKITGDNILDVKRKLKEFPEPEQQMEILEDFEKRESWGKEAFDEIIQKKKDIAEGRRHPEIIIGSDKHKNYIEQMERVFEATRNYGIANINKLPEIHRKKAINLVSNAVTYWIDQLIQMGGEDAVNEILQRAGVN